MTNPTSDQRFDFNRPLWNPVGNQTIGYAQQIYDGDMQKKQSTINAEVQTALGGKADASAVTAEAAARQAADDELEDLIAAAL